MEESDALPGLDDNLLIERLELVDSGDHMAPVSSRLMLTGRLETARERDQAKKIGKAIAQADGPRLVQLLNEFREGPPRALARVLESINDMMQDGGMDCKESVIHRDRLFLAGVVDQCVATLRKFAGDADVAAFAARTIGCIAYAPKPVPISMRNGQRPTTSAEREAAKDAGIDLHDPVEKSTQGQRRDRLLEVGAVTMLYDLLRTHTDDVEVQENGLWAVGNVVKHLETLPQHKFPISFAGSRRPSAQSSGTKEAKPSGASSLVDLGIVPVLLRSIDVHREHRGVQIAGFRAAAFLVDPLVPGSDYRAEVLVECGVNEALCIALDVQAQDAEIVRWCLFVAGNLARESNFRCEALMDLGLGPLLIAAMVAYEHNSTVQEVALSTLANLCANSEARKKTLADLGCCEPITVAMECHNSHAIIQERALAAAGNLILGGRKRCRFLIFNRIIELTVAAMTRPTNFSNRGVQYRGSLVFYLIAAYGGPYGAPKLLENGQPEVVMRKAIENFSKDRYGVVKWATAALREMGVV